MAAERRQPWMKFFGSDWRSDPKLRACSLAARGLWADMMTLMHEATPYGHLLINGQPPPLSELAAQVGRPVREVRRALEELEANGVYSRTEAGVIFSRRMTRAAARSAIARANGSAGGNPALLVKPLDNQATVPNREQVNQTVGIDPEARGQIPQPPPGLLASPSTSAIAGTFLRGYSGVYAKCRGGAPYRVPEVKYWPVALELAHDYPDADRLLAMLEVFLLRTDIGPKNVPGTPGQFKHMAPDCDRLLRVNGR